MTIAIAQLQTSASITQNLKKILSAIEQSVADIIVFPEGMLSGYEVNDRNWLQNISVSELKVAVDEVCRTAKSTSKNVIFGTAWKLRY